MREELGDRNKVRRRFVALGDSFTEGVGDPSNVLPNGVRGWADRVAEKLAKDQPGWEYANLAVRSKRLRHIIGEQLEPALAMEPTLITLYAGGNDILDFGTDMDALLNDYELLVARLSETGATLVLFTGFDVKVSAVLEPFKKRNTLYNQRVREVAAKYGAVLVDYWCFDAYKDKRMWAPDRLHMSKAGHKYLAAQVLDHLNVPHKISPKQWDPPSRLTLREWERRQRRWVNDWVVPLFGRKLRGVTLGDALSPRWPQPVKVPRKGGLKKLMEEALK
ncbi:SGNH/GDSL hydrolase family protein [Paenarthrobacter aurescens]|uniref:SGNH hydrolase n=1 Tax=Paenarthrobacter aurescens TaxID=43663 RepID=A0A4Y3NH60_PAEAU|nr:SGNH/GDSL hydrolase family protein [Paenarthrobacter aurescens]MDO6145181.1 SGNH/GDSL hydrolase family protein [Paenarthrobacter aurescens]MDO6149026.1 SGNH/GDSL hydrolase family protein [Paenarthrobacter aurescens]MDO6160272.1 SGNH/GDSL hydrolase family protein [Paenarthrobacter aurescens]MDO6164131.1 SGNH/GDSL hydrolase family protein [Paenarthrobacter aurescens]GEB21052.1 SGNH hydrolase [Paenarthrobacter aurescens]